MQRVWPRCPKCGRRWQAAHAACGTEVAPKPAQAPSESTQVEAPALMPRIDGLVMEKVLGRGGFGEVLLATRASDGRKVAVKIPMPDPDAIMRLELEGDTLHQLGGIHAPALYDRPMLDDGRPCLVMEFVPLPTLADRLGEVENGMPIDEIGRRGLSLLTALEAVHQLDLVHRDLKPENVFSADLPPVTRIFDFGLVKPPAGVPQQDTTVGTFMGTPEYMAPEQLDSSAPVDQRADIYAMGAIFYEMLAGRPPFWGNAAEVQQALANRRAPRPSRYVASAPRALEDVIIRCLAKDPVRRFASTAELTAAFQAALADAQSVAVPAAPAPRGAGTGRREGGGRGARQAADGRAGRSRHRRRRADEDAGVAGRPPRRGRSKRRRRSVHRQGEREPGRARHPHGRRPAGAQGVQVGHRRPGGGRRAQEAGRQRPLRQRRVRQAAEAAGRNGERGAVPDLGRRRSRRPSGAAKPSRAAVC